LSTQKAYSWQEFLRFTARKISIFSKISKETKAKEVYRPIARFASVNYLFLSYLFAIQFYISGKVIELKRAILFIVFSTKYFPFFVTGEGFIPLSSF